MARYEHLPIFREAYDLTVHIEKIVRNFSRYHKYTLGTDLRNKSRKIVEKIIEANNARDDRAAHLLQLRQELESFKVLARICHESGGFASTRSYLHVAERIANIARQNEGWLKKTQGKGRRRQKPGHGGGARQSDAQPSQLGLGLAPQRLRKPQGK
jgi:thymidine phosphorylase